MNAVLFLSAMAIADAGQDTQAEAFRQGKAYQADNAAIGSTITAGHAGAVPGRDSARESDLQGIYGTPLRAAGEGKVADCASQAAGNDAYRDQECAAINYVHRNPDERAHTSVSRTEPAVATATAVRGAPRAFTGDQPGLSGHYMACVERSTRSPLAHATERCLVGHAVTEGSCARQLTLTYTWQPYAGQDGAELTHARCGAGQVRGDQLALPASIRYREEHANCATRGYGTGTETQVVHVDCLGNERLHGYDARRCSAPPAPALLDPPRTPAACTTMPRNAGHCFHPSGLYAGKAQVPVFEDHWDDSHCADFDRARGVIRN